MHVELHSNDLKKARDFYSKLFGWKLEDVTMPQGGSYTMISVGEGTGGGMMVNQAPPGTPSHWLAYVGVDDIDASTKKARELGATVIVDSIKVADFGSMSIITDPAGAVLGLWQPKAKR